MLALVPDLFAHMGAPTIEVLRLYLGVVAAHEVDHVHTLVVAACKQLGLAGRNVKSKFVVYALRVVELDQILVHIVGDEQFLNGRPVVAHVPDHVREVVAAKDVVPG